MAGGGTLQIRNPHAVLAALQRRPKDVVEVCGSPDASDAWKAVITEAKQNKIPVRAAEPPPKGDGTGRLGGSFGRVRPIEPVSLEELFAPAVANPDSYGLWLALDSLQDPHNVGAIFRTAAFFGVRGIVLTQERSAPLSATAYEVASGGLESVPFASPANLRQALEHAKSDGLWILGTSEKAKESYAQIPRDRSWLLVVGNEEQGMRRLTTENCDLTCTIPSHGDVQSLNVSVAAAILIAHFTQS